MLPPGVDSSRPLQLYRLLFPNVCHHFIHVKEPCSGEHWRKNPGKSTGRRHCSCTRVLLLLLYLNWLNWCCKAININLCDNIYLLIYFGMFIQIAGLLSSLVVLVVVVAIGYVFQPLPQVGKVVELSGYLFDTLKSLLKLYLLFLLLICLVFLWFCFPDCTCSHHHGQPDWDVQTISRSSHVVEDQQDWTGQLIHCSKMWTNVALRRFSFFQDSDWKHMNLYQMFQQYSLVLVSVSAEAQP